ncbi:STAT2 protein, partial [Donacobius atricapilla]|nr:STAT2 protein [Donacobius atricapilla]
TRAEGPPGPPRTEQEQRDPQERAGARGPPGAAGVKQKQRDPGTTQDRAEGSPGAAGAESEQRDHRDRWQEVQNLANTYLEQVHQLYAGSALPMAVRQCLAAWIEGQNWRQAAEPLSSHAPMLFHSLLVLLGESLGSLGSGHEDFMLKHNLRKAHRDL